MVVQGNQRRCLTNRAAAAAAAGHSGAQIAILKQAALGARISVWWPLDEHWYRCTPRCTQNLGMYWPGGRGVQGGGGGGWFRSWGGYGQWGRGRALVQVHTALHTQLGGPRAVLGVGGLGLGSVNMLGKAWPGEGAGCWFCLLGRVNSERNVLLC